jgi:Flagellar L-ring protein
MPRANETSTNNWNRALDKYLDALESANNLRIRVQSRIENFCKNSSLVRGDSSALIKLTLVGMVIVFVVFFVSCATPQPHRIRSIPIDSVTSKRSEPLYIKRDTTRIVPKETGSSTGSLWADTSSPRDLIREYVPSKVGDIVNVTIPADLQFQLPDPLKKNGKPGEENMVDPENVGQAGLLTYQPTTNLKMKVVGVGENGDLFVRNSREYETQNGDHVTMTTIAQIPRRGITSFDVDAKQLVDVEVTEKSNRQNTAYRNDGWDKTITKKLSGFTPDLDYELSALDRPKRCYWPAERTQE